MDSWIAFDIVYAIAALIYAHSLYKSNAFLVYIASCVIVPCMAAGLMLSGIGNTAVGSVTFFLLVGFGYAISAMLAVRKNARSVIIYKIGAMSLLAGVTGIQYGLHAIWWIDRVVFYGIYSSAMAALMLLNGWELRKDWIVEHGSNRNSIDHGLGTPDCKRSERLG